jgi:aminoglycoside phosphotransferase (APT) family kinase protein
MSKDNIIKSMLSEKVSMTPNGFVADQLNPEQFVSCHELFFDKILEIHSSDIAGVEGYGQFNEECKTEYDTCSEFLINTFVEDREGYWYNWKEMFETTVLEREFFEKYLVEMKDRIPYCEGKRYLVYNNTFFENMITDGKATVGFPDWSRSGICDLFLDFAIMDLNKPYLHIPELLFEYCKKRDIVIPDFKERFLCMAYYKGIDVLRWHASIDDTESCTSIMKSISELKDRIYAL